MKPLQLFRDQKGLTLIEMMMAAGLMAILIFASGSLYGEVSTFLTRTTRQASAHSVAVRFEKEMEKIFYSNALHRFEPTQSVRVQNGRLRFIGSGWIVYDDGDGDPSNNMVPRPGFPVTTFEVNGRTLTQNSWLIERFRVEKSGNSFRKKTLGFTTSRCIDRRLTKRNYTMREVLDLDVAIVHGDDYRCCPLGQLTCGTLNPVNFWPTVFTVEHPSGVVKMIPEPEDRRESPGFGFTVIFDGNPTESFRVQLLKMSNQCLIGIAQVTKPCAETSLGVSGTTNLARDLRRHTSTIFRPVISGFNDSFFVRVGSDFY